MIKPIMETADLNILTQWIFAFIWNYIFLICFAMILSVQIIFLCGYERKRYGNKKKQKVQEIISNKQNYVDNEPVKVEPQPQQYDPPQISLCPEDTLHDVTSIVVDNETSIFMLSPNFSRTALTHSIKEIQKEFAHSPNRQTSN